MSAFHSRLKTPEELELDQKRRELARIQAELAEQERVFAHLKSEIRLFEQVYEDMLGSRIAELEDLEWQLNGLLGEGAGAEIPASEAAEPGSSFAFHHTTDLLDDELDVAPAPVNMTLKSLYREVAKAVHPDLAPDDEERLRRQELMALANQAYEEGNRKLLEEILVDWQHSVDSPDGCDVVSELVRVIRLIARCRNAMHAVNRQADELRSTDIFRFKLRVDEAMADGHDLMAEMAAALDLNIMRLKRRLAALRNESSPDDDAEGLPPETRILKFPDNRSCGTLFVRSTASLDYRDWQRLGLARGLREVLLDKSVRLDVNGRDCPETDFLATLGPDDIQALYLYDVDDRHLKGVGQLTGLQELYLSNARISDAGLLQLVPLRKLQRISMYHSAISDSGLRNLSLLTGLKWLTCSGTGISEEGLNRFRQAVPGCKAVNFQWRYDH